MFKSDDAFAFAKVLFPVPVSCLCRCCMHMELWGGGRSTFQNTPVAPAPWKARNQSLITVTACHQYLAQSLLQTMAKVQLKCFSFTEAYACVSVSAVAEAWAEATANAHASAVSSAVSGCGCLTEAVTDAFADASLYLELVAEAASTATATACLDGAPPPPPLLVQVLLLSCSAVLFWGSVGTGLQGAGGLCLAAHSRHSAECSGRLCVFAVWKLRLDDCAGKGFVRASAYDKCVSKVYGQVFAEVRPHNFVYSCMIPLCAISMVCLMRVRGHCG